jgi:hypothetical protein
MPVSCAHLRHPNVFDWLLLALAVAFRARNDATDRSSPACVLPTINTEKCHQSISSDNIARAAGLDRCRKGVPTNVRFREEMLNHSTITLMC